MTITEMIGSESRKDYALRIIRDNIIRQEFEPGSFISADDIARKLSISKMPVREALYELADSKIVEIIPQSGTRVAAIDFDLIDEALFFRRVLDTAIVEEFCEVATLRHLDELNENIKLQQYYLKNYTPEKFSELDESFHRYYYQICNKLQCYHAMKKMSIHHDRVRDFGFTKAKMRWLIDDHIHIFDAVKDKDGSLAGRLMSEHIDRYRNEEPAIRKAYLKQAEKAIAG